MSRASDSSEKPVKPNTPVQSNSSAAPANPNPSTQPSSPTVASNPASSTQPSKRNTQPNSKPPSFFNNILNHPGWTALIVAIIGGIFTIIAALIPSLSATRPTQATTAPINTSTMVATSVAIALPSMPTVIPTIAPTATPTNLSTPLGVTTAFLDALKQERFIDAANLVSEFSRNVFGKDVDTIARDFEGNGLEKLSYKRILEADIEKIDEHTLWVHVHFNEDKPSLRDCCILKKEDKGWKINLGYPDFEGNYHGIIIDDKSFSSNFTFEVMPNVQITPIRITRFTRELVFWYNFENKNNSCVTWSSENDVRATFFFEEEPSVPLPRGGYFYVPGDKKGYSLIASGFHHTYPVKIELRGWRYSDSSGCAVVNTNNKSWGYVLTVKDENEPIK